MSVGSVRPVIPVSALDERNRRRDPWFRRSPAASIAVAVVLFGGVLAMRLLTGTAKDATTLLFCLPIALLAITFGRLAGLLAGLAGVGLVLVWVLADGVELSVLGWATRAVPMLLLGLLVGDASDRLRRAEDERVRLEADAARHREAIELNDTIVQGLSAAKWALEEGRSAHALALVNEVLSHAIDRVSELMRSADEAEARRSA